MSPEDGNVVRNAAWIVAALVLMRLVAAAVTPLTFDEAYYWTWSKHLAGGYYDHAPMVAYVIRLGTMIAGDTEFGVRIVSVLLALPMSWAVYRTAQILFADARIAAASAVLLNVTLMVAVGTIIVTPDSPLMVASSFVLFCLAKVQETGRGVWWLAVGIATGFALLSKYTALFFGAEILLWLLLVRSQRHWLVSPWPYLGGFLALALFSPVIWWNADHEWVSFLKQFGRARVNSLTLRYLGEMVPTQFAFATPFVFILGVGGLYALAGRKLAKPSASALINIGFWPVLAYFVWHSLHSRVEGNWLGPIYPPFVIAAAFSAWGVAWQTRTQQQIVSFSRRWALPTGVLLLVVLVVQANTGVFTGFRRDATVRSIGVGWPQLAAEIEVLRVANGASCVLAGDYGTTSLLMFYLPKNTCVLQSGQRYRWTFMPEPAAGLLENKLLIVKDLTGRDAAPVREAAVSKLAELTRKRSGVAFETYEIDLLEPGQGDPLDRSLPPELVGKPQ